MDTVELKILAEEAVEPPQTHMSQLEVLADLA